MHLLLFIILFTFTFADCEDPNQTEYFITCDGGGFQNEVSWTLNPIGIAGGAPYSDYICLSDDYYELRMFDSYGDGWNGNLWSIYKGDFDGDLVAQCSLDDDNQNWGQCFFTLGDFNQPTCEEMNGNQCISSSDCEWIEDVSLESCSSFGNSSSCNSVSGCNWDSYCVQWHHLYTNMCVDWDYWCDGEYQIDNSYCQENPNPPPCSEIYDESDCGINQSCEWVEDISIGSCSGLGSYDCNSIPECNWTCSQWGSWYSWICYGSYYCTGGTYQDNNSYCGDIIFMQGDLNSDSMHNIQDILIMINLIIDNNYNDLADMNDDQINNILDIVELIDIILIN